jgi:hypothetical protein
MLPATGLPGFNRRMRAELRRAVVALSREVNGSGQQEMVRGVTRDDGK